MAIAVGIVGLPNSGKTTLFKALTRAATTASGKENVGMAMIADERLPQLAAVERAKKVTPAALRVVDVPGTGAQLLGNLRQVDALLAVVDGFSGTRVPDDDLETLRLELLVADRDHVERRLERVRKQAKSGELQLRKEVEQLEAVLAHLEAERPLAAWPDELPPGLEPLTTKPLIDVRNGPGGLDAKLEAELAELPEEEALESIGRKSMFELIENLSPEQQQVLTLKFVFNLPDGDVATILGMTERGIKSLQHRALVSLLKQISDGD